MTWETITSNISKFADKPIVIAIGTALTLVIGALFIFVNTSLGKKSIKKLTDLFNSSDSQVRECYKIATDTLEKVKNVERLADDKINALESEYAQKVDDLKQDYEQKLAISVSIVNYYVESLFATLKLIPNVKVKEEVAKLENAYEQKKKEITSTIGVIYQDYTDIVKNTKQELRKEYQANVSYLENKLSEITLFLEELKEGKNNGQGKESHDSNPGEEAI